MPAIATMTTVGEISKATGEPIHRVEYLLRTRDIQPLGWAGNARVFAPDVIDIIAAELASIDTARGRSTAR